MRIFGLDGGIATIGWSVLDIEEDSLRIVAAGVRTFDAPETAKERTPTNAVRRLHRGQRRVIRRRRQRMTRLRHLFHDSGLIADASRDALAQKQGEPRPDPWTLRAAALERALSGPEFARALGHIARHRGFRSNAKRDAVAKANDETSKMKKGIAATTERLAQYRTIGELFARHPEYQDQTGKHPGRKHNRGLNFDRSIQRSDQEHETGVLFAEQRRLGNTLAADALEDAFARIAFSQRPLQDSEHMLAACPFETGQKRTARRGYAFEKFRLLSRLAAIRLTERGDEWALTPEQIVKAADDFGVQKKLTWRWLRKTLDIHPRVRFAGVPEKDETNDFVARAGNAAEGTYALRQVLGAEGWRRLMQTPERRDRVAEVLSFREDPDRVRLGLEEAGVTGDLRDALMDGVETGAFSAFTRAGHISAKAARALLPALERGLVYSDACKDVGYDHAAQVEVNLDDVRNPVARKAVGEMLKQVRAMIAKYGLPELIHVELARDIGKSAEERDEIKRGIDKRNAQRDRLRVELAELLGREPRLDDLVRYELWKEQNQECLYTGQKISPAWLDAGDNRVQLDHILPWSRFGDDSFLNKTLCMASANQAKKNRTPFEWFQEEGRDWAGFTARVESCKEMKGRKKGSFYLRKNAKEVEETFRNRNLGDTRYATRLLLGLLGRMYPKDGQVHVRARPGQLTAKLRRAWGLDDLKKGPDGKRLEDDRHHALDAIVVAATTQSMLEKLTQAAQEARQKGLPRGFDFDFVKAPAAGFTEVVREVIAGVFVSRPERRRARGEAHAATIKQIRTVDGKDVVFERKAVEKLTAKDIENLQDPRKMPPPAPYGNVADPAGLHDGTVTALKQWVEAGRPKDQPPRSPKGDVIKKVRVPTDAKIAVLVRGGTADRGDMVRVDVFNKANKAGKYEYYLVPVYPHEVADRATYSTPPNRAAVAHTDTSGWVKIDSSFNFKFSLYPNSLMEAVSAKGEVVFGYFKGFDIQGGNINVALPENPRKILGRPGAKTLIRFCKFAVDRLGVVSEITGEVRTWHGEVCT
jgi:CRISPR-associated endonuclease Csn1